MERNQGKNPSRNPSAILLTLSLAQAQAQLVSLDCLGPLSQEKAPSTMDCALFFFIVKANKTVLQRQPDKDN